MDIEWDERKRRIKLRKHGVDFADAHLVFDGPMFINAETRENYDEDRWIGIGNLQGVVVVIVFVERAPNRLRVISLRKANVEERKKYESFVEEQQD